MDEVTDESFEHDVLESPLRVIVDFWAPWCKPCDAIEPHLRAIAEAHSDRVRLVRMNVDEQLGVPSRYGVLALPTVMLFAGGTARATVYGAHSRAHYEQAFDPFLVALYALAWFGVVGALFTVWAAATFWRNRTGGRWSRIHHSLIASSTVMLAWFFFTFRLAGTTLNY